LSGPAGPGGDGAAGGDGSGGDIPESVAYRVALPEFEGPLDLLLHLCKTHELDILQIPIAFVTEKYLEYLETMQAMSVEIAAEYLVMAATLAYLKARELVPNPEPLEAQAEEGEEALDPKEELIRRLLEYQKYKAAAEELGGRPIEGRNVFGRGMKLDGPGGPGELAEHSVWKLIESFADVLKKAGPKLTHDVVVDRVSIGDRINQIVDRLEAGGGSFRFDEIVDMSLSEPEVRSQLVVTLLAVLELAKLRIIRVLKDEQSDAFFIAQRDGASLEDARRIRATSDVVADEAAADAAEAAVDAPAADAAEAAVDAPPGDADAADTLDAAEEALDAAEAAVDAAEAAVDAAQAPAVAVDATEVPGVAVDATEVFGVAVDATEVSGVAVDATEVPGVAVDATEVPGVTVDATEVPAVAVVAVDATEVPAVAVVTVDATEVPAVAVVAMDATEVPAVAVVTVDATEVPAAVDAAHVAAPEPATVTAPEEPDGSA
jgi:segregation and condensation protein A